MNMIEIGENVLAFHCSKTKTSESVAMIRSLYRFILNRFPTGLRSCRPGLDTLLLEYTNDFSVDRFLEEVKQYDYEKEIAEAQQGPLHKTVNIPVCYEEPYCRDLIQVAETCGISQEEVVRMHHSRTYEVWMMGFMPGFAYIGELHESLQFRRKAYPDAYVPGGSVAIAEEYTSIYPFDSPGGWHVIGRTPASIIDFTHAQPWVLEYGTIVHFYPISSTEYLKMQEVQHNRLVEK